METLEQKVERLRREVRDALNSVKRAEQEHAFADGAYRDAIGFVAAAEAELAKAREAKRTVGERLVAENLYNGRCARDDWVNAIDAAIATARDEERARCLKLAEFVHTTCPYDSVRKLVAAIRAGRSPC